MVLGGRAFTGGLILLWLTLLMVDCQANGDAFYDRVYRCDVRAPTNTCGTTRSGAAMACFPGSLYGSVDFCAESCSPGESASTLGTSVCAPPGGLLGTCQPSAGRHQAVCSSGLACFATDLSSDRGVCLPECDGSDGCSPPVVACDATAGAAACPLSADGRVQTCVAASQLGGQDFCAPSCDLSQGPVELADACIAPGAEVRTCNPALAPTDPSAGCPSGLSCYRTDIYQADIVPDLGVCLWLHLCATDDNCPEDMRCGSSIIEQLHVSPAALALLSIDALQCVRTGCKTSGTPCRETEGCLPSAYAAPDLCVPQCRDLSCPPNYACATAAAGPGSPDLCVPGLPGVKCTSDMDCMLGQCLDTGANFSVCSLECASDLDCAPFDSGTDSFACVTGASTRFCVTPRAFAGASCDTRMSDEVTCPAGQHCVGTNFAAGAVGDFGECRAPCNEQGRCPAFGGLPHVCLGADGGCYPGQVGLPCHDDSECIGRLRCLDPDTGRSTGSASTDICTLACSDDSTCSSHAGSGEGFCADGYCRAQTSSGASCDRARQCISGACDSEQGRCVDE